MYLARKVDDKFKDWKQTENDILLVQGAPFVGKTTTIKLFIDCYFTNHFFIDLESKIGKEFIKLLEDDNFTIQKVIYFAIEHDIDFKDSSNYVLILKNIQSYEKIEEALANLEFGYFRIICTLENSIKNYFNLVTKINVTTIQMTTLTFEEFLSYYNAIDEYGWVIDTIGLLSAQEAYEHNELWYRDALEVYQNVGGFPEVANTYFSNGDWESEIKEQIINLCDVISKRVGVALAIVEKTLGNVVTLALAKHNTFEDLEMELWDYTRRFDPKFSADDARKVLKVLFEYNVLATCPIYNVKKERLIDNKYKVYFCDHSFFKALAKLSCIPIVDENDLLDNFIFSTYYKEAVNRDGADTSIYCVEKKNKSIGFLLKSQDGYLAKFITTGSEKIPTIISHNATSTRYYIEEPESVGQYKKEANELLPIFSLAKTIFEGLDDNPISLPDLAKNDKITK